MTHSSDLEAQRQRAAKNQSLFREVNERIGELAMAASSTAFVCECMTETCNESIPLTVEEYEDIRSDGNRFVVLSGHEVPEVEAIVGSTDGYLLVAKIGSGANVAKDLDPRMRTDR
ncbi:MAG: hypothetical protein QOH95_2365 [Gaiellaceae bacterium]|jgi:hypothetical protein|nr:hypothetical protein [Gaiellaceae bacterium]